MMMSEIFEKRYQVYHYKDIVPEESLVKNLITKTFKLVSSKQNIMPYKVHILGPNCIDEKQKIYEHVKKVTGGSHNHNIKAPYNLIFTTRLVTKPSHHVQKLIDEGHDQPCTDPKKYKKDKHNISLEIGMFAKVLTGLCLENNLGVSYQLCFKDWQYENEEVLFSMQLGYPSHQRIEKGDYKPDIDEVINFK